MFLKDTDKSIESITLTEAISLLKYPFELGDYKGSVVTICSGRYGLYFKYKGKNYSLKNCTEPETIDDIEEYFRNKTEENKGKSATLYRKINDKIVIKSGKYGPYIQYSKESDKKPIL